MAKFVTLKLIWAMDEMPSPVQPFGADSAAQLSNLEEASCHEVLQ